MAQMKNVIFYTFILVLIVSCSCKTCDRQADFQISVPDSIFNSGDRFIISKVGKEFFKENFFRDYIFSKKLTDGYYLRYNYRRLDYSFVDEPVYFFVDTLGNVRTEREIIGIPNCRYTPEFCDYKINEEEAIAIAKENELAEGIRPWDVSFRWETTFNRYIWHILATTWERGSGDNYKAKGEEIIIDPIDGSVLKIREWYIR